MKITKGKKTSLSGIDELKNQNYRKYEKKYTKKINNKSSDFEIAGIPRNFDFENYGTPFKANKNISFNEFAKIYNRNMSVEEMLAFILYSHSLYAKIQGHSELSGKFIPFLKALADSKKMNINTEEKEYTLYGKVTSKKVVKKDKDYVKAIGEFLTKKYEYEENGKVIEKPLLYMDLSLGMSDIELHKLIKEKDFFEEVYKKDVVKKQSVIERYPELFKMNLFKSITNTLLAQPDISFEVAISAFITYNELYETGIYAIPRVIINNAIFGIIKELLIDVDIFLTKKQDYNDWLNSGQTTTIKQLFENIFGDEYDTNKEVTFFQKWTTWKQGATTITNNTNNQNIDNILSFGKIIPQLYIVLDFVQQQANENEIKTIRDVINFIDFNLKNIENIREKINEKIKQEEKNLKTLAKENTDYKNQDNYENILSIYLNNDITKKIGVEINFFDLICQRKDKSPCSWEDTNFVDISIEDLILFYSSLAVTYSDFIVDEKKNQNYCIKTDFKAKNIRDGEEKEIVKSVIKEKIDSLSKDTVELANIVLDLDNVIGKIIQTLIEKKQKDKVDYLYVIHTKGGFLIESLSENDEKTEARNLFSQSSKNFHRDIFGKSVKNIKENLISAIKKYFYNIIQLSYIY
ncbi:MAG: hypothetical protein QXS90_01300, partial [Candidatus Diapherotrites archaeon]